MSTFISPNIKIIHFFENWLFVEFSMLKKWKSTKKAVV